MPLKMDDTTRSLPDSINAATRSVHTKLNKLVISRLRLALPPQADDASQYVSGLLHVAPIYITFESLWGTILESSEPSNIHESDKGGPPGNVRHLEEHGSDERSRTHNPPVVSPRVRSLLAGLYFEGLQRAQVLRHDLVSLTCWSKCTLAEQLDDASQSPVLNEFLTHIRASVQDSPHTLLAYAWVLYMALFSGGRFIRASLENIYPAFWVPASAQQPTPATLASVAVTETQPLSFFRFNTPADGEDLKRAFKKRLLDSEGVLTGPEREEIVREACCIFDYMVRLINELDDICGVGEEAPKTRLLSLRSRDSLVVESERRQQFIERVRRAATKSDTDTNLRECGKGHVTFS